MEGTQLMYSKSNPAPWGHIDRFIKVRTNYIGFHKYEKAPDKVAFLRNNHRHLFKVEAMIEVFHDDRELEFFLVQDLLNTEIVPYLGLRPLGSCEQQAEDIMWGLVNAYGTERYYEITVGEDGENEATVTYSPKE